MIAYSIYIFNFITFLLQFKFEVVVYVVKKCGCKEGKSSSSIYLDKTIYIYTY